MVQCVVGCASSAAWRYGSLGRVLEPDPRVDDRRADVIGVGPVVTVHDAQLASGHAHVVRLGVERDSRRRASPPGRRWSSARRCRGSRGRRCAASPSWETRTSAVENVRPSRSRSTSTSRWRVERGGLREVHRRRRHALARQHLRHRDEALGEHLAALDHVAGGVAVRRADEVARRALGVHVDQLEQVGGVTPRGEAVDDGLASVERRPAVLELDAARAPGRSTRSPRCRRPRRTAPSRSTRCPSPPGRPR